MNFENIRENHEIVNRWFKDDCDRDLENKYKKN